MKQTLKTLYAWIAKHRPELRHAHIEAYCNEAGKLKKDDLDYNYGYNSLKWIVYALRETLSSDELQTLFYHLLTDRKALNKSFYDLQYRILTFPSARPFRDKLKNHRADLSQLVFARIFGYKLVLNPTPQNLTGIIFSKYAVTDCIIFHNPETGDAGFVFNVRGVFFKPPVNGDFSGLLVSLAETENNWAAIRDENDDNSKFNLLIRKGQDTPTVFNIETLVDKMGKFLQPDGTMLNARYTLPGDKHQEFSSDDMLEAISICMANSKDFEILFV